MFLFVIACWKVFGEVAWIWLPAMECQRIKSWQMLWALAVLRLMQCQTQLCANASSGMRLSRVVAF